MFIPKKSTTRPRSLEKVDEACVRRPCDQRSPAYLSQKLLNRMRRWAGEDASRMKQLALLSLSATNGWTAEMLSRWLGVSPQRAAAMLDEARAAVPRKAIGRHLVKEDNFVALRTRHVEALLRLRAVEHLIDGREVLDAIEESLLARDDG